MFDDVGFMELLLIGILGLVVLGPERLPVAVRSIAGWIRTIKRMANSVKDELEQELQLDKLHNDLKKAETNGLSNLSPELQASIDELKKAAESVNRPYQLDDVVNDKKDDNKPSEPADNSKIESNTSSADPISKS